MSETFTNTRRGIVLTVWAGSYDMWYWRASKGSLFAASNFDNMVKAYDRVDAWNKAMELAALELWTASRIDYL